MLLDNGCHCPTTDDHCASGLERLPPELVLPVERGGSEGVEAATPSDEVERPARGTELALTHSRRWEAMATGAADAHPTVRMSKEDDGEPSPDELHLAGWVGQAVLQHDVGGESKYSLDTFVSCAGIGLGISLL